MVSRFGNFSKACLWSLSALLSACGTQKAVVSPYAPMQSPLPAQTVVEQPRDTVVKQPEPVVVEAAPSAKPLVSTVERAEHGTWKGHIQETLDSLCATSIFETTQLGLYVYDITADSPIYAVNASQRMRPASNQKVITAISALHTLKGNYKFKTQLRKVGDISGGTLHGDIYVVGGMDPLLSYYDLTEMAQALKVAGIDSIAGHMYADVSLKDNLQYGWGWCWDDDYGPLSALMVDGKDCFAQQWAEALNEAGIGLANSMMMQQQTPDKSQLVFTATHTMDDVLVPMMKKSENIYAECLFYQIAFSTGVKKAGRKQAVKKVDELIKSLGLDTKRYQIADGSGLSLYNYVTPELLVRMLNYAYCQESIRTHLLPSLPIAAQDGTLEKRMKDSPAALNVHAKTGTVDGISSLSGYLTACNGHVLSFSIINQGIIYSSTGKDFQDKVCDLLCR